MEQQKLAAESGYWPLYRFDPRKLTQGESPLMLDSAPPKADLGQYMRNETRFRLVEQQDGERFRHLLAKAKHEVTVRWALYEQLAHLMAPSPASDNKAGA